MQLRVDQVGQPSIAYFVDWSYGNRHFALHKGCGKRGFEVCLTRDQSLLQKQWLMPAHLNDRDRG
jgi:hypothetical protein